MFYLDPGVDTGDIIDQRAIPIEDIDDCATLYEKVSDAGTAMLLPAPARAAGRDRAPPTPGRAARHGHAAAPARGRPDRLDARPTCALRLGPRADPPVPGAFTELAGRRLFVWRAETGSAATTARPGTLLEGPDGAIEVATGDGTLRLHARAVGRRARGRGRDPPPVGRRDASRWGRRHEGPGGRGAPRRRAAGTGRDDPAPPRRWRRGLDPRGLHGHEPPLRGAGGRPPDVHRPRGGDRDGRVHRVRRPPRPGPRPPLADRGRRASSRRGSRPWTRRSSTSTTGATSTATTGSCARRRSSPRGPMRRRACGRSAASRRRRPRSGARRPGCRPFTPNLFVDIDAVLAAKLEAFAAYESEVRPWPHPRSLRALEAGPATGAPSRAARQPRRSRSPGSIGEAGRRPGPRGPGDRHPRAGDAGPRRGHPGRIGRAGDLPPGPHRPRRRARSRS